MLSLDNIYDIDDDYKSHRRASKYYSKRHSSGSNKRKRKSRKLKKHRRKSDSSHLHDHDHDHPTGETCAVCLGNKRVTCQLLPCDHKFHGKCIAQWVENSFTCPLCRSEIEQFVPLDNADPKLMNKFESLWIAHYSKSTNFTSNGKGKELDEIDLEKLANITTEQQDILIKKEELELETQEIAVEADSPSDATKIAHLDDQSSIEIAQSFEVQEKLNNKQTLLKVLDELIINHEKKIINKPKIQTEEKPKLIEEKKISVWENTWKNILKTNINKENNNIDLNDIINTCDISYLNSTDELIDYFMEDVKFEKELNLSKNNILFNSIDNISSSNNIKLSDILEEKEENEIYNNKYNNNNIRNIINSDDDVFSLSSNSDSELINAGSGTLAGLSASIVSLLCATSENILLNNGKFNLNHVFYNFRYNIPTIAGFFTSYEFLKLNMFNVDPILKSKQQTFEERFISACLSGSIASYAFNHKTIHGSSANPVIGLRFGTFFGTFEMFKDIKLEKLNYSRQLNLNEVALCAFGGSLVASSLYYPATNIMKLFAHDIALTNAVGKNITINSLNLVLNQININLLYKGFTNHLMHFVPQCVTCSCAFEFTKRYFTNKSIANKD